MGVWLLGFKELNFKTLFSGKILNPLANLWKRKETRYALLAAFIASFALVNEKKAVMSVADKVAAVFSIVLLFRLCLAFMALTIAPFYARAKNKPVKLSWNNFKLLWLVGMFSAVQTICFFSAYRLTEAAYAGSFKRLWVIFAVFFGWLFFKEKKIVQRLFVSLVIFLGVFIAYYFGK